MKPFLMNEFDWVIDKKSGKSVLIAPWFGDLGVWYNVPQPLLPEGLKQEKPPMPDRIIIGWPPANRQRLVCDLLNDRLQEEMSHNAPIP